MSQTSIEKFLNGVEKIYKQQPKYATGCDGSNGQCDCIGLVRGALKQGGATLEGLSGTNYASRYTIKNFKPIDSIAQLELGDVVIKGRPYSKTDSYPLPTKYLPGGAYYNGDTTNYYHIGVVTKTNPLEITHMTSPSAKKDVKLGKWNYFGQLPQIDYDEVVIVLEYATVVGGSLNMRRSPDIKADKITSIPSGSKVAVIEKGNEWCKAVYNAYTGYVMTRYLKFESGSDDKNITISLSRDCAEAIYEALKLSLNK